MNHITLYDLLTAKEGENLEFKEKKHRFDFEELVKYACAIANCGGGHIVYGVTDKRPRQVVGTTAIEQPERTRRGLMDRIGLPFDFQFFEEDGKRVVVFIIPPRPVGMPVQDRSKGIFWWRDGDSLIPVPEEVMRCLSPRAAMIFPATFAPPLSRRIWTRRQSPSFVFSGRAIPLASAATAEQGAVRSAVPRPHISIANDLDYCDTIPFNALISYGRSSMCLMSQTEIHHPLPPRFAENIPQEPF